MIYHMACFDRCPWLHLRKEVLHSTNALVGKNCNSPSGFHYALSPQAVGVFIRWKNVERKDCGKLSGGRIRTGALGSNLDRLHSTKVNHSTACLALDGDFIPPPPFTTTKVSLLSIRSFLSSGPTSSGALSAHPLLAGNLLTGPKLEDLLYDALFPASEFHIDGLNSYDKDMKERLWPKRVETDRRDTEMKKPIFPGPLKIKRCHSYEK
jgi:hypothetical protein